MMIEFFAIWWEGRCMLDVAGWKKEKRVRVGFINFNDGGKV